MYRDLQVCSEFYDQIICTSAKCQWDEYSYSCFNDTHLSCDKYGVRFGFQRREATITRCYVMWKGLRRVHEAHESLEDIKRRCQSLTRIWRMKRGDASHSRTDDEKGGESTNYEGDDLDFLFDGVMVSHPMRSRLCACNKMLPLTSSFSFDSQERTCPTNRCIFDYGEDICRTLQCTDYISCVLGNQKGGPSLYAWERAECALTFLCYLLLFHAAPFSEEACIKSKKGCTFNEQFSVCYPEVCTRQKGNVFCVFNCSQ